MDIKIKNRIIDRIVRISLLTITILSALFIVLIIFIVASRGVKPFFVNYEGITINFFRFITGRKNYYPDFRIGFIIINTLYIVFLSTIVASFISVLTALFIAKIASKALSTILTTIIEVLAAIPSIIFGVFGMGYVTRLVRNIADFFNITTAGGLSTLSTIIVLSMMIMPTITMVSIVSIKSVKKEIEEGSLALGASKIQTIFKISLNSAKPGIFAGIILGVGRALGEATAVSMVSGGRGNGPTFSLFDTTITLTSSMLTGIKEGTEGLDYDIRFSIGLVLITIIIVVNMTLNLVKKRLGKHYGKA